MLFLLLILNFAISWFNAWSVGRVWIESKMIGGLFRMTVWCGAIMSAFGFTWLSRHYLAVTWQWARDHSQLLGAILASKESDQRWNRCLEYVCTDLKYSERCPLRSGGNRKRLFGVQR